jgi:hypothetical protein
MAALRSDRRHLRPASERLPLFALIFTEKNSWGPGFAAGTLAFSQLQQLNNSETTAR